MRAVTIIQDEHRAITAVIEGLRHLVAEVAAGRIVADQALLAALFHYIEAFPERLHHPKEDEHLFARLRIRRPDLAPLLDGLAREHVVGRER
ncbi:MAG: hemerythrin domain-containing protein, partial [Burkholderiales bacterium]|nr:hemerythrin domain-containing protein [Burkholderiales bacterium]